MRAKLTATASKNYLSMLSALTAGFVGKRESWGKGRFVFLVDVPSMDGIMLLQATASEDPDETDFTKYCETNEDIAAEDWMVLKPPTLAQVRDEIRKAEANG